MIVDGVKVFLIGEKGFQELSFSDEATSKGKQEGRHEEESVDGSGSHGAGVRNQRVGGNHKCDVWGMVV